MWMKFPLLALLLFAEPFATARAEDIEWWTDRPGSDYRNFEAGGYTGWGWSGAPNPRWCQALCKDDPRCLAWTVVLEWSNEVYWGGRCWHKDAVPDPEPCDRCVSGIIAERVPPPPPPPVTQGSPPELSDLPFDLPPVGSPPATGEAPLLNVPELENVPEPEPNPESQQGAALNRDFGAAVGLE
ncbi:MAG: PAN domain-containing protein, partial [Dongiaceae bacterium]